MPNINEKDIEEEIKIIKKKINVIEKERDLALSKIQKRVEARQIQKIVESLK